MSSKTAPKSELDENRTRRPHVIYVAIGFPPAAKSSTYRLRATANEFVRAGWDVTVLNLGARAWQREFGLDHSLNEMVDPAINIVELDLARQDLATDIRKFTKARALDPIRWSKNWQENGTDIFPEKVWGRWRTNFADAAREVHRQRPADLVLATCAPYMTMGVARDLFESHNIPYAIDYRDGWAIDVIGGKEAFESDSLQGRLEATILEDALSLWTVNDPIGEFYRERFPQLVDRIHVVRNGYDPQTICPLPDSPDLDGGLVFGHLGVITSPPRLLEALLDGWRLARQHDPLVARSTLEFRGQIGAGSAREANAHTALIAAASGDGVAFGGPAPQADVPRIFADWDVLVLMIMGGRFMTSGKVYEYAATGLPVMSVHEREHDASTVMTGHPLWVGPEGFSPERISEQFRQAAQLAANATPAQRVAARDGARSYLRSAQLAPAVEELARVWADSTSTRAQGA